MRKNSWWLGRLIAGSSALTAAVLEHRRLEGAELGHPHEAGEVATMGQLGMARRADQPPMLRPVQAAVEEVVELGAGHHSAGLGEHALAQTTGALASEG